MKIADVCGFYTPEGGGVRTYVDQKLKLAARLGVDVTILAPGAANAVEPVSSSARIQWIESPPFVFDRKYHNFADRESVHAAIDAISPDFIEASSPWNSAEFVASYPGDQPRSLVMHSDPLSVYAYRWFEGISSRQTVDRIFNWYWEKLRRYRASFNVIVAANSSLTQRLQAGGISNAVTVPMGVEPGVFSPALRDEALRERLLAMCGLGPEATLLVCAGRLSVEKRVPMLVEAATIAGQERPLGMVIFGDGRARRKIVHHIGGNPHIRLLEPVRNRSHFAAILASADALLHGCESETFGMIAAETIASGTPIIAPNVGGTSDFVRGDSNIGFLPGRVEEVVDAIRRLLQEARGHRTPASVREIGDHFDELYSLYRHATRSQVLDIKAG